MSLDYHDVDIQHAAARTVYQCARAVLVEGLLLLLRLCSIVFFCDCAEK